RRGVRVDVPPPRPGGSNGGARIGGRLAASGAAGASRLSGAAGKQRVWRLVALRPEPPRFAIGGALSPDPHGTRAALWPTRSAPSPPRPGPGRDAPAARPLESG